MTRKAYSVTEFADMYGIGRSKAFEELLAGRLKAKKCGSRTLIGEEEAEQWFKDLPYLEVEK